MRISFALAALVALAALPAQASFHFMQIEQAVGGVGGDTTQQAVQLRMRFGGQNQMQFSRLRAFDAAGQNPVLLIDFTQAVAVGTEGARVLAASAAFATAQGLAPDAVFANPIPAAYLAGGRITFEDDGGTVVFSLCWGTYTGPSNGSLDNDADGNYGPCEPGPLPSGGAAALRFQGAASALSTNNAADFALSDPATFTRNDGTSTVLVPPPPADRGGDCDDTNPAAYPGQLEVVGNLLDDDCDGLADEDANGVPSSDTNDFDGDGITLQQGDCHDARGNAYPGLPETIGDLVDNDCDGLADESADDTPSNDPIDRDGDGHAMYDRVFVSGFE